MDPRDLLDDAARRRLASFLLDGHLRGRLLPPGLKAVDKAAAEAAADFLEALAVLYGVEGWNEESYRAAYLDGAISGWQPGTRVVPRPSGVRTVSPSCPIASEADVDPRVCELCQAFRAAATRLALGERVEGIRMEGLIRRGDAACVTELLLAHAPSPSRR